MVNISRTMAQADRARVMTTVFLLVHFSINSSPASGSNVLMVQKNLRHVIPRGVRPKGWPTQPPGSRPRARSPEKRPRTISFNSRNIRKRISRTSGGPSQITREKQCFFHQAPTPSGRVVPVATLTDVFTDMSLGMYPKLWPLP